MAKGQGSLSDETTPLLNNRGLRRPRSRSEVRPNVSPRENASHSEDVDARFKRWLEYVGRRKSSKNKQVSELEESPQILYSVFEQHEREQVRASGSDKDWDGYIDNKEFTLQVLSIKKAIKNGLHPKMIQTGSSGSYFVRACIRKHDTNGTPIAATNANEDFVEAIQSGRTKIVAVFKPHDEEPYGTLNPKRVLLRRYLWWAMGRPCLIASFSYLSEVGASILDDRLRLFLVPSTRLEEIGSSAFSYTLKDREQENFKEKIGSYQYFLHGYINASAFLRMHPWPSRPRNLLEQDLKAENHAHGRARARARKGKAIKTSKQKGCLKFLGKFNCCASPHLDCEGDEESVTPTERRRSVMQIMEDQTTFSWTKDLMQDFRLELEKLVCLDYLMRNTDRGLDNFMVKAEKIEVSERYPSGWKLILAAIDNSLAFPWKHPAGIRSYPWGWLYLPTDLIGGNFSSLTREAFLPYLSDARWWRETEAQLENLFRKDAQFDEKKFKGQMEVLRGQGWNLVESLRSEEEGPLELCARQKQMVKRDNIIINKEELPSLPGSMVTLTSAAEVLTRAFIRFAPKDTIYAKHVPAVAISILQKEQLSRINDESVQPRSLPEGNNVDQISSSSSRWQHASVIDHVSGITRGIDELSIPRDRTSIDTIGDKTIGKAYRGKSLGIDVLAEIDKRSNKIKRPKMKKALTGHVSNYGRGAQLDQEDSLAEITFEGEEVEDRVADSVASLPTIAQSSSPHRPQFLRTNRHRNFSVGDYWSISSVFERGNNTERTARGTQTRIQVIVERLEADNGIAWQTWLGLQ